MKGIFKFKNLIKAWDLQKSSRPVGLSARLIFISLPVIGAISVILWCPMIREYQEKNLKEYKSYADSQAVLLEKAIRSSMLRNDRRSLQESVESVSGMKHTLWIRITDNKDNIKVSSNRQEIGYRCPEECAELDQDGNRTVIKKINGRRALLVSRSIENNKACYTASCHFHKADERILGRIELAYDLDPVMKDIRKQGIFVATFGIVSISSLLLMIYLIVRMIILKRISLLIEASKRIAEGDLSVNVPVTAAEDEISQLSSVFNYMVAELRKKKELTDLEINGYRQSLIQAQKMEAIGLLSTGIAHDFNNLLTGIMGLSELSLLKVADKETKENLRRIINTAERGANLCREILLIGRKLPPEKKPMNINVFVNDSFTILRRMVEEKIELRMILKDNLPIIDADQSQLTQVLMNLVVNARDAIEGSGIITISTDEVVIDESYCKEHGKAKPGHYVVLSVRDTGLGIPDEIKDKIFNPFFTTKEKGKGTGLGLSVTYGIIASHDGWMSFYSEVGKGTEFRVYLPARIETGGTDSPLLNESSLLNAPTSDSLILLVDDEEMIRDVGRSILESLGYKVITASNGKEAVEIFSKMGKEISLVIMDLVMPVMDGEIAFKEIKKMDPDAKVIISSGYSVDRIDVLKDKGVAAFVSKPYRLKEIAETVRKVLDED